MAAVTKPIVTDETAQEMLAELKKITNAVKRITLTITMKTVNDTPVTDEKVVVTNTATGTVLARVDYVGQPVTVEVNQDTEYAVTGTQNSISTTGFYAPSTVTGIAQSDTNITIEYLEVSDMSSLEAVRIAIAQHPGEELLPVGTKVTIPVGSDSRTYCLMSYGYPTLEDGSKKWGAYFMQINKPITIAFDAPENEKATETYATSGLSYYAKSGNTYTKLSLNPGDEIPYGDYDEIYHNEFSAPNANIVSNGCGIYDRSAIAKMLRSDAETNGAWWYKDHIGDMFDVSYGNCPGYMYGMRQVDIDAVADIQIGTFNPITNEIDTTVEKFFLPTVIDLFGVCSYDSGEPWQIWRDIGIPYAANDEGLDYGNRRNTQNLGGDSSNYYSNNKCYCRTGVSGATPFAWSCCLLKGYSVGVISNTRAAIDSKAGKILPCFVLC